MFATLVVFVTILQYSRTHVHVIPPTIVKRLAVNLTSGTYMYFELVTSLFVLHRTIGDSPSLPEKFRM